MTQRTRERILDGAAEAVALHGLAKLEMTDVSELSGVSRGTLYRYFPDRESLLAAVAQREGVRFKERMLAAIAAAPPGAERLGIALEHATRHVREHAALQRLLATDPAIVIRGLRAQFEGLKREFGAVLAPLLREVDLVKRKIVGPDQLIDWVMRLMVSAYLLPHPHPEEMAQGLTAVYRILAAELADEAGARSHSAAGSPRRARAASGASPQRRQRRARSAAGDPLRRDA